VAIKLRNNGGATIANTRTIGPGALIDAFDSGEMTITGCRSEGANGRPAWKFVNCRNTTIINAANEGTQEAPALFLFEGCSQFTLIAPQLARARQPVNGRFSDGIKFVGSVNCHVLGASSGRSGPAFTDLDPEARLIRVDAASRYITGTGIQSWAGAIGEDMDVGGEQCYFEVWYEKAGRVHTIGRR
jgi:hypothetical protein